MTIEELIEQNEQYSQIVSEFGAGKNSHAYFICSPDSLLATNMCYMLASKITGASSERIKKGIHPDVLVYGADGKIDAAAAANIIDNLYVSSYEADYKVFILLGAHDMNETVQNKLLKSLEEPPSKVIFLLTATSTENILQTVISRVNLVNLQPLSGHLLLKYLVADGASSQAAEVASANANGNLSLALKLTSPDFLKMHSIILDILQNLSSSGQILQYSCQLDAKNIDKLEFFDVVMLLLRDTLMILGGQSELIVNKFCLPQLQAIAAGLTMPAANKIIKVCLQCKQDLQYNANATATIDKFLFRLAEEKSKCKKL